VFTIPKDRGKVNNFPCPEPRPPKKITVYIVLEIFYKLKDKADSELWHATPELPRIAPWGTQLPEEKAALK
jgi:hypothetical protein